MMRRNQLCLERNDSLYDIIGIADVPEDNVAAGYEDFLYGDKE